MRILRVVGLALFAVATYLAIGPAPTPLYAFICKEEKACNYMVTDCQQIPTSLFPVGGNVQNGWGPGTGQKCGTRPCGELRCPCGPPLTEGVSCDDCT